MTETLIILAAGASSRMKRSKAAALSDATNLEANTAAKTLIGLGKGHRPFLDYLLMNAKSAGYTRIVLVVGENYDAFKKYYGHAKKKNKYKGMLLDYAIQSIPKGRLKPYGTADALLQTLEQYPELQARSFTVCNSDNLYSVEALSKLKGSAQQNSFIAYDRDGLDFNTDRIASFALVKLNSDDFLKDIIEKPAAVDTSAYTDDRGAIRVSMNIFKFDGATIFPYLKTCLPHPVRNEKELPTAILNLCKDNPQAMKGIPLKEHVPDLTSKEDIIKMQQYIAKNYS